MFVGESVIGEGVTPKRTGGFEKLKKWVGMRGTQGEVSQKISILEPGQAPLRAIRTPGRRLSR